MTYARALDLNIYIQRDFKPLEDRMRDIVTVEDQAANIMTAAKTNLAPILPKPYVDLGIEVAKGLGGFSRERFGRGAQRRERRAAHGAFQDANKKAVAALRDFAVWLTKERLPQARPDFAIGAAKFQRNARRHGAGLRHSGSRQGARDRIAGSSRKNRKFADAANNYRSEKRTNRSSSRISRTSIQAGRVALADVGEGSRL